jgi:hypothetical protein
MQIVHIERQILALTDDQLEKFVREWANCKKEYVEVQRFTGPGDMGRDVVGYLTNRRHEGPWHNYQCKQYARTLPTALGLAELGKVLYYSHSPYPASAGCATAAGSRRTRLAPPSRVPVLS